METIEPGDKTAVRFTWVSTMTSSIKILLFDLPGFNPGFKIVLKLLKLPPEVVFRFGF